MPDSIAFAEFGRNFVHLVITAERVRTTIGAVVGDAVAVGPLTAGPADAARATLRGRLVDVDVTGEHSPDEDVLRFHAVLRVDCTLAVKAPVIDKRYRGQLTVPLDLVVRTVAPVRLVIDVRPPAPADIGVQLTAGDRSGRLLQRLGNIDAQVQAQAAVEVAKRVEDPETRRHREVDILAMVDDVWMPD